MRDAPQKPPTTTAGAVPDPAAAGWNKALVAAFFVWTFATLVFPLCDTDFWWHLKTGELILQERTVPQVDRYTFVDYGAEWIDMHWGFQVLITLLYRAGGASLVVVTKAAVITAAVAFAWRAAGPSLPPWLKALFWFLPVIAISGRGYERPEMLSQLFLAIWLFVAFRVEERPGLIWLLPAVQLLWANCHALFVLGLVVGGCYALDRGVRSVAGGRFGVDQAPRKPELRMLLGAALLAVAACFATPYLEDGFLFPLTLYRKFTVDQAFYSTNIGEFQQPIAFIRRYGLTNFYLLAEIGTFLLTTASFVWLLAWRRRWSVLRLGLFVAYSHLAWEATRNTNIFSLVAGTVLCANVADRLAVRGPAPEGRFERRLAQALCAGLACLIGLVVSGQWNEWGEKVKPFGLGEAKNWFIHEAAQFAGQPGFPTRAFIANNGQASVYIYHNWPERRVFMDGRLEVCSLDTFRTFNRILDFMAAGDPRWVELVPGGELPTVILDARTSLQPLLLMRHTPGWRLVHADPAAAVFLDNATADRLRLEQADWHRLELPPKLQAAFEEVDAQIRAGEADANRR